MATTTNETEQQPLNSPDVNDTDQMVTLDLENKRDPPTPPAQQRGDPQFQKVPSNLQPPPEKDWAAEMGMACNKFYVWFPLGIFAWVSGWLVIACELGDLIATQTDFIEFWLYVYLFIMALVLLLVDMPIEISTKSQAILKFQLAVFDWIKLLRRIWGRCLLYLVMMMTCASFLANDDDPSDFRAVPWIAGLYLLILIITSFVFSFIAAKKYNAVRLYILQSTVLPQNDGDYSEDEEEDAVVRQATQMSEGDEEIAMKKFIAKFNELDTNNNGRLGMEEIRVLGEECGNKFSRSELHAMMLLLDKECNGVITKPEWILQLKKYDRLRLL